MKAHLAKLSLALLSAVFLLGCQEQGSGPVGPDGLEPAFARDKPGKPGGGGGRPGVVFQVEVVPGTFCDAEDSNTLLPINGAFGFTDKGGLFTRWEDLTLRVTLDGGLVLDGNAQGNVQTHKGEIIDVDMQIRDRNNDYDIYRMVDLLDGVKMKDPSPDEFTLKVNRDVQIFGPVKGSKLGPSVGTICVGELVYTPQ